jgi:hypothetical protein
MAFPNFGFYSVQIVFCQRFHVYDLGIQVGFEIQIEENVIVLSFFHLKAGIIISLHLFKKIEKKREN